MVKAWYMDNSNEDQRKQHLTDPPEYVNLETLRKIGVNYWKIDVDNYEKSKEVERIRKDNNYDYEDDITCHKDSMDNYDKMLSQFFQEHIHTDDETRLVVDGSGYFDVRDPHTDRWIRIEVVKTDMISIPPGLYHRFTLDEKNYIRAKRFFAGTPVWTPLNRPQEDHPVRQQYLARFK